MSLKFVPKQLTGLNELTDQTQRGKLEHSVWILGLGFEPPSGRDIFCPKNFDTFTRTPVRVSKMNAVAHAQLTYQMLTLLQKYLYR